MSEQTLSHVLKLLEAKDAEIARLQGRAEKAMQRIRMELLISENIPRINLILVELKQILSGEVDR